MTESGEAKAKMAEFKRKELDLNMKIGTMDNLIR